MCPKCGGCEFETVTLESVLQKIRVNDEGQVHWGEPLTLAVVRIQELRCLTCGVDFSHDEMLKQLLAERCS